MSDTTQMPPPAKTGNGFGVTAMVVGIIAVLLAFVPFVSVFGIVLAVVAIVFAVIGLIVKHRPRGMAIAGLVLGIGAGLIGLLFSIIVYGAVSAIDDSVQESEANRKPHDVAESQAFSHDVWEAEEGWKIKHEVPLDMVDIKGLRLTNTGDSPASPLLTFNLDKGENVLASIDCSGPNAQPGQSVRLECVPDNIPDDNWESISVRNLL